MTLSRFQVFTEPRSGKGGYFFQCAWFFEQMRCTRHDLEFLLAAQPLVRLLVPLEDHVIQPTNNQERGRFHPRQGIAREVGASASRYDSIYYGAQLCRRDQGGGAARARTKVADAQMFGGRLIGKPPRGVDEPLREEGNVKPQVSIDGIRYFFVTRQKVKQTRSCTTLANFLRNELVPGAMPAASTPVSKQNHPDSPRRNHQLSAQHDRTGEDIHLPVNAFIGAFGRRLTSIFVHDYSKPC